MDEDDSSLRDAWGEIETVLSPILVSLVGRVIETSFSENRVSVEILSCSHFREMGNSSSRKSTFRCGWVLDGTASEGGEVARIDCSLVESSALPLVGSRVHVIGTYGGRGSGESGESRGKSNTSEEDGLGSMGGRTRRDGNEDMEKEREDQLRRREHLSSSPYRSSWKSSSEIIEIEDEQRSQPCVHITATIVRIVPFLDVKLYRRSARAVADFLCMNNSPL